MISPFLRCSTAASVLGRSRWGLGDVSAFRGVHQRAAGGGGGGGGGGGAFNAFVRWTTQQRNPERWTASWWKEQAIIFTVFGVTGSSSLLLVRPLLPKIGLEGSYKEGPWSYRIGSLLLVSPVYTLILLTVGTVAGRHNFFATQAQKMWGRFLPKSMGEKVACAPARQKHKAAQHAAKSGPPPK